jgi:hypothetical protein
MSLLKHGADLDLHLPMRDFRTWSDSQIETLYPGCFALVMVPIKPFHQLRNVRARQ